MSQFKSDFLRAIEERGFLHQCTDPDGLDALCAKGPVSAYIGFDCTAPSLHVGHLMPIMLLRILQQTGHRPIVLMGGGTTRVGDPSFRDKSRPLLDDSQIEANMAGIKGVFAKYLDFGEGPNGALMVNNADWLDSLEYIPFLREIGSQFSVNRMLSFDSVKSRLEKEQSLTFLEFNYMILQAYDFLELARRHDCVLQMGASDQWGNIVNGVELGRRVDARTLFGLTAPLITTSSGAKMGKSADGAIWLNEESLSPYEFWQYWRNTADQDMGRFLRLFTELPLDEIRRLESLEGAEINEAKIVLATGITAICHGAGKADEAAETARRAFVEGDTATAQPGVDIARAELEAGLAAYTLFARAGLCASLGEAKRLIKGGGARVNDVVVKGEGETVDLGRLDKNGVIKLTAGKKRHALVRPV